MFDFVFPSISVLLILLIVASAVFVAVTLRRVVPTNQVHIVQSSKLTTPYGRGKPAGNTYYAWPSWVPKLGITVTEFPESIFQVSLQDYDAYDQARLPFMVDVVGFFRVQEAEMAAQRVATFAELKSDLQSVLQGAVRRILATNDLEDIMQSRAELARQFTDEVTAQISEWGVTTAKSIEFMDLRDSANSPVISNIMAKEKSRIERESRIAVAENHRTAELAEIDARRTVDVQRQDAEQQVGMRTAEKDKQVGIANEMSRQEVQTQAKVTAERNMEVKQVEDVRAAEIAKDVAVVQAERDRQVKVVDAQARREAVVVDAEGEKNSVTLRAEGELAAALKGAEGIRANGEATADAEKAMQLAQVQAQITLAQEIGEKPSYQQYLVMVEQVKAGQAVGLELAKAMQGADLKVIANSGDVQGGITQLGDLFTPKGGTSLTGMLAALAQTEEGKSMLGRLTGGKASVVPDLT